MAGACTLVRTSYSNGTMKTVLSEVLVTTAGFTSQTTASSGTITSAKPNAVTDWQTAARNAMSAIPISVSVLKWAEMPPVESPLSYGRGGITGKKAFPRRTVGAPSSNTSPPGNNVRMQGDQS